MAVTLRGSNSAHIMAAFGRKVSPRRLSSSSLLPLPRPLRSIDRLDNERVSFKRGPFSSFSSFSSVSGCQAGGEAPSTPLTTAKNTANCTNSAPLATGLMGAEEKPEERRLHPSQYALLHRLDFYSMVDEKMAFSALNHPEPPTNPAVLECFNALLFIGLRI